MKQLNFRSILLPYSILLQFLFLVLLGAFLYIWHQGKQHKACEIAYQNSISVSMDSLHKYKVADSLNAIHISNIELSLKQ